MKKILTLTAALAAASMIAACGKQAAEPEATSVPIDEGKTIVRVSPADESVTFEGMDASELQDLCQKLVNRLESAAYSGYELEFEDSRTLAVRNVADSEKLRTIISAQGKMTVTDTDGQVCMTDDALEGAWYAGTPDPQVFVVRLDFTQEGAKQFADITERLAQETEERQYLSFALDGAEFARPRIDAPVAGSKMSVDVEAGADSDMVTAIAVVLNSGELPAELNIVEEKE